VLRFCSTPTFPIFNLSGFEREPLKLCKQMISHYVALDVGSKICQVQLCSSIMSCHRTFVLKSTLFKGKVEWQLLVEQQDCSPSILESQIRAFKWGIGCFSTIIHYEDYSGYIQKCTFLLNKINFLYITTYIFKRKDGRKTNSTSFECSNVLFQNTKRTALPLCQRLPRNLSFKKCTF